jgi:hypothetical protein
MLFETLFSSDDSPDLPELWAYAADPTIANARALLTALRLPAPYERLRESKRSRGESPGQEPGPGPSDAPPIRRTRRGGAPPRPQPPSSPPRRVAAELVPSAIAIHERVDAIHDAYNEDFPLTPLVVSRILSAETTAAAAFARFPGLGKSVSDLVAQLNKGPTFTYKAFGALNAAFGLNFKESGIATLRSDRRLYEQVTRWRFSAKTEIVLDGLVQSPNDPSLQKLAEPERTSRIARSQALCAFVMLLLADYDPALAEPYGVQIEGFPEFSVPSAALAGAAPSVVEFLVGPFQTMDGPHWRQYLSKWTDAIRSASPRIWKRIGFREIAPPLQSASGAEIRASDVRLPNGTVVPFYPSAKASASAFRRRTAPPKRGAAKFAPTFAVSATKTWFRSLFYEYSVVTDSQRAEMEPLIDNAIAVNALRDAVKADVALARGAVYITYDRLAMLYYTLRRTAQTSGDALWLHARGIGDAKLGTYEA